ncbi:dihydroxyacetone kinase phosphoryl donor subunit DhaM [Gracilibacillus xinjiangensis]|uniref:phosphoenolpyruvate--glycerone phosphotransferase n=1 Tax=Gracilibacillus xinjiangensis TaxID=1193282 RepID=A0ABV8WPR6_9BACI
MNRKVAIIIVSHSVNIGQGIKDLISQVITNVPILMACGIDNNEIGTSIEKIQAVFETMDSEAEGIIFYDLGSAKMNAEMAIEMFGVKNLQIAEDVPIVEGAYIAAVESNMGKSKDEILNSLAKLKVKEF